MVSLQETSIANITFHKTTPPALLENTHQTAETVRDGHLFEIHPSWSLAQVEQHVTQHLGANKIDEAVIERNGKLYLVFADELPGEFAQGQGSPISACHGIVKHLQTEKDDADELNPNERQTMRVADGFALAFLLFPPAAVAAGLLAAKADSDRLERTASLPRSTCGFAALTRPVGAPLAPCPALPAAGGINLSRQSAANRANAPTPATQVESKPAAAPAGHDPWAALSSGG